MKRNHVARLIAGLLTAATFTAAAQSATTTAEVAIDTQSAEVASKSDAVPVNNMESEKKMHAGKERLCPRDTGTRIVANADKAKRCSTFGRVYTSDDLQRTGAADIGDALRKLDPSIR